MTDEKKNIHVLKGGQTPNITADALRTINANLPFFIEYIQITAKLHRAKFKALRDEGFNDTEALELCKIIYFT